jgi:hypothetical protein
MTKFKLLIDLTVPDAFDRKSDLEQWVVHSFADFGARIGDRVKQRAECTVRVLLDDAPPLTPSHDDKRQVSQVFLVRLDAEVRPDETEEFVRDWLMSCLGRSCVKLIQAGGGIRDYCVSWSGGQERSPKSASWWLMTKLAFWRSGPQWVVVWVAVGAVGSILVSMLLKRLGL